MIRTGDISALLYRWRDGDRAALDQLMPLVYPRLRAIAQAINRRQHPESALQATALVNEVFLKLVKRGAVELEGREHFYSMAAQAMRQILSDHARHSLAAKRGGRRSRAPLHEEMQWISINHEEMIDLNTAMDELAEMDPRKVRVVELRYFLGSTAEEAADVLGISKATVDREAEVARAWLFRRLKTAK